MTQPLINQIPKSPEDSSLNNVQRIRTEEREHLANTLHDSISPLLAIARMNLEAINLEHATQAHHSKVLVQNTLNLLQHTIEELKEVTKKLQSKQEGSFNLKKNLEEICKNINDTGLIYVSLNIGMGVPLFNTAIGKELFNILKELLHNTLKHANATAIEIKLKQERGLLMINYKDNGNGMIPQTIKKQNHLGLNSIYLRMQKLNGNYQIDATPDDGFHLIARIPISFDHLK